MTTKKKVNGNDDEGISVSDDENVDKKSAKRTLTLVTNVSG